MSKKSTDQVRKQKYMQMVGKCISVLIDWKIETKIVAFSIVDVFHRYAPNAVNFECMHLRRCQSVLCAINSLQLQIACMWLFAWTVHVFQSWLQNVCLFRTERRLGSNIVNFPDWLKFMFCKIDLRQFSRF